MKNTCLTVAILGGLLLSGCFSLDNAYVSSSGEEHVVIRNYGWKLFNTIPLACGNATPAEKRHGPFAFFRNDVTTDKLQAHMLNYASKHGKTVDNMVFQKYDTVMINIPLTAIPIPIPYIICYKEIQLSGVMK